VSKPTGSGERLYSGLLRLYSRKVREEYGPEMLELFRYRRDLRLSSNGRLGLGFWAHVFVDAWTSAWNEWRRPLSTYAAADVSSTRGGDGFMGWIDDFRYAGRRLVRSPGFTLTALTILVLGIGVNTTAYSVVNALLLQPPPFHDPDQLVNVLQGSDGGTPSSTSYPAYLDMTRMPDVFASVSAYSNDVAFLEQGDGLASILIEYATATYMDVIGLTPSRGIWFEPSADDPNGAPAAVITHAMWTDRLGSDPGVLGSTLRIGGGAVTVIGVGPVEFNGGQSIGAVDLWLSISAMAVTGGRAASLTRRQDHPFTVRARLAPGVSMEQASGAMDGLAADLARIYPDLNSGRSITVLSVLRNRVSPEIDGQLVPAAVFLMAVVMLVLVIGTLNLANLLLVRSTARAREIAVRLAIGASRGRVVRVVLAEALLLAVLGGAGGLGLAQTTALMVRNTKMDVGLPILIDLHLDASVFLFTALVSVSTGLLFGLLPALRATRRDVNASLRDVASNALGPRRRLGLTGALVAGQVAVSLLLLAIAGVFLDSLSSAQGTDPGFAWQNTAFLTLNAGPLELGDEGTLLLLEQMQERIAAVPGVGRVATSLMLPADQRGTTTLLLGAGIDGIDSPSEIPWNYVSPSYFDVLGVPLLHGRLLVDADVTGPDVAVVSAAFARTYWGRTDVVGETYRSEGSPENLRDIVGVVGDATVRVLGEAPTPSIYWPLNFAYPRINFIFELEGSSTDVLVAARAVVGEIDPRIMILGASSMEEHLGDTLQRQRLAGNVLGMLGALALVLAMLGVYGVVSFAVSQRRREVGIRIALGAASDSVVGLFLRDVAVVVLLGCAVGLLLAVPAGRLVGQIFTGGSISLVTTGSVAALLVVTSLVAAAVPAARASRTNPTNALRQE